MAGARSKATPEVREHRATHKLQGSLRKRQPETKEEFLKPTPKARPQNPPKSGAKKKRDTAASSKQKETSDAVKDDPGQGHRPGGRGKPIHDL